MPVMRIVAALFLMLLLMSCGGTQQSPEAETATPSEKESLARIEELKENIADEPNKIEWRFQLAKEYEKIGQDMEAMKTYEEALALDPGQTDMRYNYAELAMKMGDLKKAYQSYKDILLGVDGQQYLARIGAKFMDTYKVTPVIASSDPEAFGMYSPDGQKIIYQMYKNDNWDLYEYDVATQASTQLTSDPAHEENPAYSPDMRYIVYTSTVDDHRDVGYDQKLRDIYIKDRYQNRITNLTANSSNDWRPRFSPTGKFIVFVSERSDLRDVDFTQLHSHIFDMEPDGSFQLELTEDDANDGNPVMTGGESDPIYFDSNRTGDYAIFEMKGDGTDVKQLTFNSGINDAAPDISSDGVRIAFVSDRDGNYEIYTMNNEGGNQQKVTSNPADDLNPIFSPDGKKILFHSNRSGNFDILELDLSQKNDTVTSSQVISMIDAAMSAL
jgi:dipeptidyl aminopeptidase/acylaminoacyl peptidase